VALLEELWQVRHPVVDFQLQPTVGSLKQELASFRSRVPESKQLSGLELIEAAASGASLARV
jgi:hypothetical protein